MTNYFEVWSDVDPRDLRINKKFRNNPYLPPGVSRAQDNLILDIKRAIPDDFFPCPEDCSVRMKFVFPDNRTDVDGPIKRSLDALERALKARGYRWHDGKVTQLVVQKERVDPRTRSTPGIFISMM